MTRSDGSFGYTRMSAAASKRPRLQLLVAGKPPLVRFAVAVASLTTVALAMPSWANPPGAHLQSPTANSSPVRKPASHPHHVGYASYYAQKFSGRKMADGTPMRPESDNAASLTLPLGSKAMVTNLLNGRTALVTIRDRGPFIKGRIIDVSPSTARLLGILSAGVARVTVIPLDRLPVAEKLEAIIAAADAGDPAASLDTP